MTSSQKSLNNKEEKLLYEGKLVRDTAGRKMIRYCNQFRRGFIFLILNREIFSILMISKSNSSYWSMLCCIVRDIVHTRIKAYMYI